MNKQEAYDELWSEIYGWEEMARYAAEHIWIAFANRGGDYELLLKAILAMSDAEELEIEGKE